MGTYHYRGTCFAGRDVDITETTILRPAGVQLCTNPDFEVNTTGWIAAVGTETLTRDTATKHSGAASLKVVTINSDLSGAAIPVASFPVGGMLAVGFWFEGSSAVGKAMKIVVSYKDGVGTFLGTYTATFTAVAGWQYVTLYAPAAPATTTNAIFGVVTNGAQGVFTFYLDDVLAYDVSAGGHVDLFQVTTQAGQTNWRPYLGTPKIRRGELDPLTKRVTVGQATVPMLDLRTNANRSQLQRWVTAFLGTLDGRNQFLGGKFYLEESTDGGATFSPYFVGRIDETHLDDPLWWDLILKDLCLDMDVEVFGSRPHASATAVIEPLLCPIGISATYGQLTATPLLSGTVGASSYTSQTAVRVITLDAASQGAAGNLVTRALLANVAAKIPSQGSLPTWAAGVGYILRGSNVRCRFSYAGGGITAKELTVHQITVVTRSDGHYAVKEIVVSELKDTTGVNATTDPFYSAFDTGTVPNAASLSSISLRYQSGPAGWVARAAASLAGVGSIGALFGKNMRASSGAAVAIDQSAPPIVVGDVAPMTFLGDLLTGYYGPLYTPDEKSLGVIPSGKAIGDPKVAIPYDTSGGSNWDKLASATTGVNRLSPTVRWIIAQPSKLFDFLERQYGQVFGVGYRFKPALLGGVPVSKFEPIDLRLPSTTAIAGIPTIADADLVAETWPQWSETRQSAVSDLFVTVYDDITFDAAAVAALADRVPDVPVTLLTPAPQTQVFPAIGRTRAIGIGSKPLAIDAAGYRYTIHPADTVNNVQAETWARGMGEQVLSLYRAMFGSGAGEVTMRVRRTTNTTGLWPGDWCYLSASGVPSPAISRRGDTRLLLIVARNEDGPEIELRGIDAGPGTACNTPTIGTPTQMTGNINHGATVAVTTDAQGDQVELRYYIDTTGALTVPPADTDPGWIHAMTVPSTGSYNVQNLPSNVRFFPQGRSVPRLQSGGSQDTKLPSAWVAPSGTKFVALGALTPPNTAAVTPATILAASTVVATWVIPAASVGFPVNVYLDGTLIATLSAGSTTLTLNPYLVANHAYTLTVKVTDGLTGLSSAATTTFTTPVGFGGPTLTAPGIAFT